MLVTAKLSSHVSLPITSFLTEKNMTLKSLATVALTVILVSPAFAQDDAKGKKKKNAQKGRSPAAQLIKQLEPVGLTEDQVKKINEMAKASAAEAKKMKEDAGITTELLKKRTEAQKALKESGKKGKEMTAAVNEKAGITAAQAEVFAKLNTSRQKMQRAVIAMLTDDQKSKLPEKMQRLLKAAGGKKKGGEKKKKKAE